MKNPDDDESMAGKVMTTREAAVYLKCHPFTLNRLAKRGEIPAFKVGGSWRFLRSALDEWIARLSAAESRLGPRGRRKRPK
jgi:excisionase family DNA binding protein